MAIPEHNFHGAPGAAILDSDLNQGNVEAGVYGEKYIDRLLRKAEGIDHAHVFYAAKIPGRKYDADIIIATGNQVRILDAKNWANGYHYKFISTPNGATVVRRPFSQPNAQFQEFGGGEVHIKSQLADWKEALPRAEVTAALVIVGNNISVEGFPGFMVTTSDRFLRDLRQLVDTAIPDAGNVRLLDQWTWKPVIREENVRPQILPARGHAASKPFKEPHTPGGIALLIAAAFVAFASMVNLPGGWFMSLTMLVFCVISLLRRENKDLRIPSTLCALLGTLWPTIYPMMIAPLLPWL